MHKALEDNREQLCDEQEVPLPAVQGGKLCFLRACGRHVVQCVAGNDRGFDARMEAVALKQSEAMLKALGKAKKAGVIVALCCVCTLACRLHCFQELEVVDLQLTQFFVRSSGRLSTR